MKGKELLFTSLGTLALALAGYVLALNDIFHDYLGSRVKLRFLDPEAVTALPAWTGCPAEWGIAQLSTLLVVFSVVAQILFLALNKEEKKAL